MVMHNNFLFLVVSPIGVVRCLYGETLDLRVFGPVNIRRASHVEPDAHGEWWADLKASGGTTLGPFARRSEALAAEVAWLEAHWLLEQPGEKEHR